MKDPNQFRHIVVVDPASDDAHIDCFNHLVKLSPLPLTYHLPALAGWQSLATETNSIAGIIVLGSNSSVNDRFPWQLAIEEWIKPRLYQGIPTFGICWGHQMISRLLGGQVAKLPQGNQLGFRKVSLESNPDWDLPESEALLFVCHGEAVVECPSELKVVGKSPLIAVEATRHRELPIWTFQSHPEAVPTFAEGCQYQASPSDSFSFGHSLVAAFMSFARQRAP